LIPILVSVPAHRAQMQTVASALNPPQRAAEVHWIPNSRFQKISALHPLQSQHP
jgi:hypothetical protein